MFLLYLFKLAFTSFLLVLFFLLFGIPSLEKFKAKKTLVLESTKTYNETDHPAITICPYSKMGHGWKDNVTKTIIPQDKVFQTVCNSAKNASEAFECINKNTYVLSEMMVSTVDDDKNVLDQSHWQEDISWFLGGKCHTLNASSVNIGSDWGTSLTIIFNASLYSQYFFVHDPNFFILGPNPRTMPRILDTLSPTYGTKLMYIEVIEHVKLNLPNKPCKESPSYSLTGCIRNSFSQKIGCRPEWDRWSDQEMPVCKTMEQLKTFEQKFFELSILEQMDITDYTGCLLPCRYKEYKKVDDSKMSEENRTISFVRASKGVLVKTEELVYPFSSFLAEFGGALGLFVGFSFLTLWDVLQFVFNSMARQKNCIIRIVNKL